MEYKVSVIIPVYNADKYLRTAIESVINQTIGFENIELIIVNDNSTDNSRRIIEEYSSKYDNIVDIHLEKNSGYPGKPRNVGIEIANAPYLIFLDADDEYLPEALKRNGINTISANLTWETFDYMSQDEEITYLPETLCELIGTEGILKAAQRCIFSCKEEEAICVVMLHAYDFPDEETFVQFDSLLSDVSRMGGG